MFRATLCPSSGAQEYNTVVAACGISCCGFQVAGLLWSWGLCVRSYVLLLKCVGHKQFGTPGEWCAVCSGRYSNIQAYMFSLLWHVASIVKGKCFIFFTFSSYQLMHIQSWCDFDRESSLIYRNKLPTKCNRGFYCRSYCLLNMFRAPLFPSTGLCVRFAGCCSILQTGHITLSSPPVQQLEHHSTKYNRQQPLYNTLGLLMMGLVVPETCWASKKICNKNLCCI